MAGAADRENEAPGERSGELQPIQMNQIITCDECDVDFDHTFTFPGIFDREMLGDMDEHEEVVTCPNGHTFPATYSGWTATTDAG